MGGGPGVKGCYPIQYTLCYNDIHRITPIQSPIATFDVAHYWQCVFGPHPRAVVLAEQASVCLLEFLEDTPTYSLIIDKVVGVVMVGVVLTC